MAASRTAREPTAWSSATSKAYFAARRRQHKSPDGNKFVSSHRILVRLGQAGCLSFPQLAQDSLLIDMSCFANDNPISVHSRGSTLPGHKLAPCEFSMLAFHATDQ
jgi:hypothetical protein